MNKQLEKLCDVYKSLDAKHLGKSSALSMLCKSRNKAYNSVIPVTKVEDIQEDVVAENLEFCELLAKVSSDINLSKGVFENVMTIISNMNKTSFGLLDEDNQMQVLEGEIGIVRGVFKELKQKLLSIFGVGPKVADCVALFGFHRSDSFPVDTWIEKVYREDFKGKLKDRNKISEYFVEKFKENSGYYQQYLFYYKRMIEKQVLTKK